MDEPLQRRPKTDQIRLLAMIMRRESSDVMRGTLYNYSSTSAARAR